MFPYDFQDDFPSVSEENIQNRKANWVYFLGISMFIVAVVFVTFQRIKKRILEKEVDIENRVIEERPMYY
uniref:Uncharacterized protein n=1 Tax=Acrobeloides nanus TaxID=290746 RepID=A0A914DZT4_9BILA